MKWCFAIVFILATLGGATEVKSNDPPSLEGLIPTQIEKIMIQELLEKPGKNVSKQKFDFLKTVKPVLKSFEKQLLADKDKMQKQLLDNKQTVEQCVKKMKKETRVALLEVDKKKKKKNVKTCEPIKKMEKEVKKCEKKIKDLGPKKVACNELEKIGKKDVDGLRELIKDWNKQTVKKKDCIKSKGETKFHYVSRLANHFGQKSKGFKKKINELLKKKMGGKNLKKQCDVIKHVARHLANVTCTKIKNEKYVCQCGKVIKEKKICGIYDGCYEASNTNLENDEKEIRKKNAAAKLEWRAVGRIECILKVLGDKKQDPKKLEACVRQGVNTTPMNLKYCLKDQKTGLCVPKPKCELKGLDKQKRGQCK